MSEEHYVWADGKKLRCGFTTGTCAALAAQAAAIRLLTGIWPEEVSVKTPKGWTITAAPQERKCDSDTVAFCGIRKDGGDDVDRTNGALICAEVTLTGDPRIVIDGGDGVGRVTKPGLDQPVGAAAINSVPREMIQHAVRSVFDQAEYALGAQIRISVPEGAGIAEKTFNPQLGIEGGISILGTSGIVEPMSVRALIDTIETELKQAKAMGAETIILTPGNYGTDYIREHLKANVDGTTVRCSNYIGDALDLCKRLEFQKILLVGHMGKLAKIAGGVMNTHSSMADCRTELFCAHAAVCGASTDVCKRIMNAATTDACMEILMDEGLDRVVVDSMLNKIQTYLQRRVGDEILIGAILFSNRFGEIGRTRGARDLLGDLSGIEWA